ncbi:serine/threonine protein phosphatase, partial [Burkholderia pseudomallei]
PRFPRPATPPPAPAPPPAAPPPPDGTPDQIPLTWGDADANAVVVSWASLAAAPNPRVRVAGPTEAWRTVHGGQRTSPDGLNG